MDDDATPAVLRLNDQLGPLPTSSEDEAIVLARLSKTPAEAYERGFMDGHARAAAKIATMFDYLLDEFERLARYELSNSDALQRKKQEIRRYVADLEFKEQGQNVRRQATGMAALTVLEVKQIAQTLGWELTYESALEDALELARAIERAHGIDDA